MRPVGPGGLRQRDPPKPRPPRRRDVLGGLRVSAIVALSVVAVALAAGIVVALLAAAGDDEDGYGRTAEQVERRLNRGLAAGRQDYLVEAPERCDWFVFFYDCHEPNVLAVDHDARRALLLEGMRHPTLLDWGNGLTFENVSGAWTAQRTGIQEPGQFFGGFHVERREGDSYFGTTGDGEPFRLNLTQDGRFATLEIRGTTLHYTYGEQRLAAPAQARRVPMMLDHVAAPATGETTVRLDQLRGSPPAQWLRVEVVADGEVVAAEPWSVRGAAVPFSWEDADGDGRLDRGETYRFRLPPGQSLRIVDEWAQGPVRAPVPPLAGPQTPLPALVALAAVAAVALRRRCTAGEDRQAPTRNAFDRAGVEAPSR